MSSFNTIWENEIYSKGKNITRYPYDSVVSFIYRNHSKHIPKKDIKILELGSGTGNNLWFAAREGFNVTGIDGSESAIEFCKKRFLEEKLEGNFIVGDFSNLPFEANIFDIIIDRGAIVCCNYPTARQVIQETARVLKQGGKFFFNPYSQAHSSFASGQLDEDGFTKNIQQGLLGVGDLCFYSYADILRIFSENIWQLQSIKHKEYREVLLPQQTTHAEWEVIAMKK